MALVLFEQLILPLALDEWERLARIFQEPAAAPASTCATGDWHGANLEWRSYPIGLCVRCIQRIAASGLDTTMPGMDGISSSLHKAGGKGLRSRVNALI